MNINDQIKKLRKERNMTLEELAKATGTIKQTIFKYENGIVTKIPYEKVILLAKALKVTPGYLMGWETEVVFEEKLTADEKAIIDAYRQHPDLHSVIKKLLDIC